MKISVEGTPLKSAWLGDPQNDKNHVELEYGLKGELPLQKGDHDVFGWYFEGDARDNAKITLTPEGDFQIKPSTDSGGKKVAKWGNKLVISSTIRAGKKKQSDTQVFGYRVTG